MYLVKKTVSGRGYGKKKWDTIFVSPDNEGALAVYKSEYRMLLESDASLTRENIDRRLSTCYSRWNRRSEAWHGDTGFAMYKSEAAEHQVVPERPNRTEQLDKILGS